MNDRQTFALANPAGRMSEVIRRKLYRVRMHPRGFEIASILAVDL